MVEQILRRGEVGSEEFGERFGLARSTVSYHAKVLASAGLITTRREGRFFFYRPVVEALEGAMPGLARQLKKLG